MAKYQKKKIQDTENSGFGKYDENTGGGASPEPWEPGTHGHGVNSDYRQENNDTWQPRTSDGKFTYKSVNGKSIDPQYGPSRGKTVNPLLTGGVNGIMIDDVEQQFYNKSGKYYDKYKDKWYQKGSEYILMSQGKHHKAGFATRVAGDAIWNVAKQIYNEVTGDFGGDIKFKHGIGKDRDNPISYKIGSGYGGKEESKTFQEGKRGAPAPEEKAAKQLAQATGQEQAVIDKSSGGIKLKPGVKLTPPQPRPAPQPAPIGPSVGGGVSQPTAPANVNTANVGDIVNADYQPKYSDEDIEDVKSALKEGGFSDKEIADFESLSPKEKDDYIDKYFGSEEEVETEVEEESAEPAEPSEPEREEEDEDDEWEKAQKMFKV